MKFVQVLGQIIQTIRIFKSSGPKSGIQYSYSLLFKLLNSIQITSNLCTSRAASSHRKIYKDFISAGDNATSTEMSKLEKLNSSISCKLHFPNN